jgi:SNF2 family DNA or RNA helicase
MLKLIDGQVRWGHEDVRMMAKIIGSEHAVISEKSRYRTAPLLGSMVRLAARKGLSLSRKIQLELEALEAERVFARKLKRRTDARIDDAQAERFFAHQRADLYYMRKVGRPSYLLAHDPGVGKTLEAIRMAEYWHGKRIAVITPNTAKEQWRDEIFRWVERSARVTIVEGTIAQQVAQINRKGWIIGHWESLVHAREGWLEKPWDVIILDEAHHISNRRAQRSETAFKMRAEHRLALTGHPFANATSELFALLRFMYPKLYTSFWRWAHLQIEIDEGLWGGLDLSSPRRPKLLKWELEPIVLRHTKKEVWPNLPEITRRKVTVHLSKKARREYEKLKKQFFVELAAHDNQKKILAIPGVLARITRMRQYLIDPGILGAKEPSAKYAAVLERLDDVEKPCVIFTAYRQSALRLHTYLTKRKKRVAYIVGGMQREVRKIKKKFLLGKLDAVIIMIQVGGTALNFGKYGYVIGLDFPWNAKDLEQPEGRVDRPEEGTGKMVPTTADWLCVKDSYEERMMQRILDKRTDFAKIFTVGGAKEFFR